MATFIPDRPPLSLALSQWNDIRASIPTTSLTYIWNERDIYPIYLDGGHSYEFFISGSVDYQVWDDFARMLVDVPALYNSAINYSGAQSLNSLFVETSGLHYIVVEPSQQQAGRWLVDTTLGRVPEQAYYGLTIISYEGDRGPSHARTSLGDLIDGGAGNDLIVGLGGNDTIRGLDGNDRIDGDLGDDDVNGNLGDDVVYGGPSRDFVRGGQGDDWIFGGDGDDWHVNGNIGNDIVYGDSGNDVLFGGPGFDRLYGGFGNDTLSGDLGNDSLYGELHADLYCFGNDSGQDTVFGFNAGEGDRIQIAADVNASGIVDFASLVDRIVGEAGGSRVDLGGSNTVFIVGTGKTALTADLFGFG